MAWIESHQELAGHPKTKKFARLAGVSLPAAVGHLHFLWWWALDYAQDGGLSKFDIHDIADACGWDGDAETLVSSLVESQFVDQIDGELYIHDWDDYAGRLLDKRRANTERKRKSRGSHARQAQDIQSGHRATEQNQTIQNQTEPEDNPPIPPKGKRTRFTPPTLEEVIAYCEERQSNVDAGKWFDFYSSKGWMVGRNKMTDWRAAVRTWEKSENSSFKPNQSQYQRTKSKLDSMLEEAVASG